MKIQQNLKRLFAKAGAYKYAALILLLGVALMLIPQEKKKTPEQPAIQQQPREETLEERLETVLSQMDGAGRVRVLLSYETGKTNEYQTDEQIHTQQEETESQTQTVLIDDGSGGEAPITVKTIYPTYQGALILCQGADRAAVRLNIVKAVSDLTGLGSDKISVIKMKDN